MLEKSPPQAQSHVPNDLAAFWMPFTSNRAFKQAPRMLAGAKDMHYFTTNGRKISTVPPACGAPTPVTAAAKSPRR